MCGADRRRDEVFLCHDIAYFHIHIRKKTHIAICDDADKLFPFDANGNAGNLVFMHECFSLVDKIIRCKIKRICNNAVFASLYLFNLIRLHFYRHILVDYTYSALACHGYGETRFRYGIHCRRHDGRIESYLLSQSCGKLHLIRKHIAFCRNKKHIVKGQALFFELIAYHHIIFLLHLLYISIYYT